MLSCNVLIPLKIYRFQFPFFARFIFLPLYVSLYLKFWLVLNWFKQFCCKREIKLRYWNSSRLNLLTFLKSKISKTKWKLGRIVIPVDHYFNKLKYALPKDAFTLVAFFFTNRFLKQYSKVLFFFNIFGYIFFFTSHFCVPTS